MAPNRNWGLYQNKYGNREIHDAVADGQEKLDKLISQSDDARVFYPLFVPQKKIPLLQNQVSTVFYNAGVLFLFSIFLNALAVFMLSYRNQLIYIVKKILRRQIIR